MAVRATRRAFGPFALTRTLAWLRVCAIMGQSLAVLFCAGMLSLPIPAGQLAVGISMLVVFAIFAAWRLRQPWPVTEGEAITHITVDTLCLGYLLHFTGGATNPFITLLLVPIALSATALAVPVVLGVASLAALTYIALLHWYIPLPLPAQSGGFMLHVAGMGVSFLITTVLLSFFINRLANALREQQMEVQQVRERALRYEGILAIATQAAGAAHEMNTPLSTMMTLLPELRREHTQDGPLAEDLALLQTQVERCRESLREMVAFGKAQLSQTSEQMPVSKFVHACLENLQLLRPEADVTLSLDPVLASLSLGVPAGLRHALVNLLNNAVDASGLQGSQAVELLVRREGAWLELAVRDQGPGFAEKQRAGELGLTGKQTGLGLALALAEATAERLKGELITQNMGTGAEVRLRLPLAIVGMN